MKLSTRTVTLAASTGSGETRSLITHARFLPWHCRLAPSKYTLDLPLELLFIQSRSWTLAIRLRSKPRRSAVEVFYTPQEPDGKLFILKQGRVRIFKMEASREFTLELLEAGTVFGEVAFTLHHLRDAYAEATEPSVLLAMEPSTSE